MSNKIFRSIITTAALVLLASFVIIIGVLYGYFTQVIEKQLREELDIAAAAVEEQGGEYIKKAPHRSRNRCGRQHKAGWRQHSTHADIKHGGSYL